MTTSTPPLERRSEREDVCIHHHADAGHPDCGHEFTHIHPYEHVFGIPIDELLAPLIRICWRLRIHTAECCQEFRNPFSDAPVAYIAFEELSAATAFITLLAAANSAYAEDFLHLDELPSDHDFRVVLSYQGGLDDPALPVLIPTVTVEFPTELIGELTDNVCAYLVATAHAQLELFDTAPR